MRLVHGGEVEVGEAPPLFLADLQVPVHIAHVLDAELAHEPVVAAEGLGREGGEMIDASDG
jgi:hypothetical protein